MVYSRYAQPVRGLRADATAADIPADPYDIPVSLAKRLTGYGKSITLNASEQAVYDRAVKFLTRTRALLLPLLALVRLPGAGERTHRPTALRRSEDRGGMESRRRLRRRRLHDIVQPARDLSPSR